MAFDLALAAARNGGDRDQPRRHAGRWQSVGAMLAQRLLASGQGADDQRCQLTNAERIVSCKHGRILHSGKGRESFLDAFRADGITADVERSLLAARNDENAVLPQSPDIAWIETTIAEVDARGLRVANVCRRGVFRPDADAAVRIGWQQISLRVDDLDLDA